MKMKKQNTAHKTEDIAKTKSISNKLIGVNTRSNIYPIGKITVNGMGNFIKRNKSSLRGISSCLQACIPDITPLTLYAKSSINRNNIRSGLENFNTSIFNNINIMSVKIAIIANGRILPTALSI